MSVKKQTGYGPIVFTNVELLSFNKQTRKGVFSVEGKCSGKKMFPIKITKKFIKDNSFCANPNCGMKLIWFIADAKTEIINYLPASNEIVVRVKIKCECGTIKESILLLSLENKNK